METITYFLGAGFSAHAGIPVMSNFLTKAKDLYFDHPDRFPRFRQVFQTIERLSVAKNYFVCDLFNIEEILSILETERLMPRPTKASRAFADFVCDVVEAYTPDFGALSPKFPANWHDFLFGGDRKATAYGMFFASLLGLSFSQNGDAQPVLRVSRTDAHHRYSIVTLNYDMIPEIFGSYIAHHFLSAADPLLNQDRYDPEWSVPHIAKLHGSLSDRRIVPPTWAKSPPAHIKRSWQLALQILQDSNHIRIVGYSLPFSDNYVSYLLKAAIVRNQHLKSIDVICRDSSGDVQRRYDSFVAFPGYRFARGEMNDYFEKIIHSTRISADLRSMDATHLERAHQEFMLGRVSQHRRGA